MPAIQPPDPGSRHFRVPAGDGGEQNGPRRPVLMLALAWVAGTLLLFLGRPGYTFPPLSDLDSWVYSAYQWDLRGHLHEFGPLYYGSRLSWIVPGALLHGVLPPVVANLCFKLLASALLATAGAILVYRTLGYRGALLLVVLSVFSPPLIYALHTDYIDTAVILYGTWALAAITLARNSKYWMGWILFGGGAFAGMVVANVFALVVPGLGIAVYHLLWLRWNFRRQLACVGLYMAATVMVLAGFGLVNRHIGGDFIFLRPQLTFVQQLTGANPWAPKDGQWAWAATWLILPMGALLWGLFQTWVARSAATPARLQATAMTGGLAASLTVAIFLQARGQPVLSLYFYASLHLSLALPLLAACCTSIRAADPAADRRLLISSLAMAVLVLTVDSDTVSRKLIGYLPFLPSAPSVPIATCSACLVLALLVNIAASIRPVRMIEKLLGAEWLLLSLVVCSIPDNFHSPNVANRLRERYATVHAAFTVINDRFATDSFRLWEHPGQWLSRPLASTWLWGYRIFSSQPFPQFDPAAPGTLGQRKLIITAPTNRGPETVTEARKALARVAEITDEEVIHIPGEEGIGIDLVILSLRAGALDLDRWDARQVVPAFVDLDVRQNPPYFATLAKNLYAETDPARPALVTAAGVTRFTSRDPRDHLATPFVPLPAATGTRRQLVLMVWMPSESQTLLTLQDEAYRSLKVIDLRKPGRSGYVVDLPAGSGSIRLCFSGPTHLATALPERVTLYLTDPNQLQGK